MDDSDWDQPRIDFAFMYIRNQQLYTLCSRSLSFIHTEAGTGNSTAHATVIFTDMSKKSTDRLRDPALKLTMRDHATYFLTICRYRAQLVLRKMKEGLKPLFIR